APALAAAVAETADGAVSKPVELGESVFLAFRAESENSGAKPLSEVWDELRKGLIAKKKAELFKAWIGHLRADAVIVETLPWDDENGGETQPSEQNDGDRT
ncbi:MAG: hypothetical protein IJS46_05195, partial [Kiritimatiellae bacterium]|nr:hypothetical protein [Kiritimatiellia bacterium]